MKKINRTCLVCGHTYEYCPVCGAVKSPTWMSMFEKEECMTIFTVCSEFNAGMHTVESAQKALEDIDLSKRDEMAEDIQMTLKKIFAVKAETPKPVETQKPQNYQDNKFKKFDKPNK